MIHYAHTFWATLSHINTQKFFSHDPRDHNQFASKIFII